MQKELATATGQAAYGRRGELEVDNLAGYFEGAGASEARSGARREILSITAAEDTVSRKLGFTMGAMLVAALAWWCWERHRNSADRIAADLPARRGAGAATTKARRPRQRQDKKSARRRGRGVAEEAEPAPRAHRAWRRSPAWYDDAVLVSINLCLRECFHAVDFLHHLGHNRTCTRRRPGRDAPRVAQTSRSRIPRLESRHRARIPGPESKPEAATEVFEPEGHTSASRRSRLKRKIRILTRRGHGRGSRRATARGRGQI